MSNLEKQVQEELEKINSTILNKSELSQEQLTLLFLVSALNEEKNDSTKS